jgi:hypothetical protein
MRKTPASMRYARGCLAHPRADDHSADDAALYGANRRSYARIAGHPRRRWMSYGGDVVCRSWEPFLPHPFPTSVRIDHNLEGSCIPVQTFTY